MTDRESFLASILAEPADDNVRLVFADFLQEQGEDARAEFIRVQCELARLQSLPENRSGAYVIWREEYEPLRARERELYDPVHTDWFRFDGLLTGHYARDSVQNGLCIGWARDTGKPPVLLGVVRRGFAEEIECRAEQWLTFADLITAAQPVTAVTLTTRPACASRGSKEFIENDPLGKEFEAWEVHELAEQDDRDWDKAICRLRWPHITFTLPPNPEHSVAPGIPSATGATGE